MENKPECTVCKKQLNTEQEIAYGIHGGCFGMTTEQPKPDALMEILKDHCYGSTCTCVDAHAKIMELINLNEEEKITLLAWKKRDERLNNEISSLRKELEEAKKLLKEAEEAFTKIVDESVHHNFPACGEQACYCSEDLAKEVLNKIK